MKEGRSYEICS